MAAIGLAVSVLLPSAVVSSQASSQVGSLLAAGETAYKHRDYQRAITFWQRALPAMEKAHDPRLGDVYFYTGSAYYSLDNYTEALASFQRALVVYRNAKSRPREAADLSNIGLVQESLSRYADSLASLQQALALYRDLRDRSGEADGLGNVGVTQMRLGRYADALASQTAVAATLSACNTGVETGATDGEGVSGLTRAFLYAGSPAISVTLWEVDDAAAPRITPAFFAGMHAGKLSAAEALRRAKLTMLAAPEARFRHPYAWAPSVIFGDGDRQGAQ